ncbi:MAG: proline--tRNA ligase, partial [Candidatus Coatesbacteria bacterium]
GVPLRLELGPKDLQQGVVTAVRRDTREKTAVPRAEIASWARNCLTQIQADLLAAATASREEMTRTVETADDFYLLFEGRPGFVRAPWCGGTPCEEKISETTGATIRFLTLTPEEAPGLGCVACGKAAATWAYFAKAY